MRRIFGWAIIGLFLLSLIPMAASANLESTSTALKPGTLVKGSWQAVYYFGADGKRYVFPNEKTYMTWYVDFNVVIHISDDLLGSIPIGGNVTYKPNSRLVKITTDPKVYWVGKEGTLRHVTSEEVAKSLYGYDWNKKIDDIPDAYFVNYKIGEPLTTATTPSIETSYSINQDKLLSTSPDPSSSELGTISLTGAALDATTVKLGWTAKNFYPEKGFKVVMADHPSPVYPGDDYHYLSDPNTTTDKWYDLFQGGTYYFRVCEYLGNACGIYSNEIAVKVAGKYATEQVTDKKISLTAAAVDNYAKLSWTSSFNPPLGFKVVISKEANPVYPGNDYHYLSDPSVRLDKWTGLTAGTYHFRVCEYLGGSCGVYSNDVSVTIAGTVTDNSNGSISLIASWSAEKNKVILEWKPLNMYSKVVESTQANPVYPGNDYHYLSSPDVRSDTWAELPSGTHHFRVCEYLGGSCGIYSNDVTVNVP